MTDAFLDTSGWLAALNSREFGHAAAKATYGAWMTERRRLVTTNLVVAEMQVLISRSRGPGEALRFLDTVYQESTHEVVHVDRELERAAVDHWLRRFADQRFSLADAVSFEVMREWRVKDALTLDSRFQVAGFRVVPVTSGNSPHELTHV